MDGAWATAFITPRTRLLRYKKSIVVTAFTAFIQPTHPFSQTLRSFPQLISSAALTLFWLLPTFGNNQIWPPLKFYFNANSNLKFENRLFLKMDFTSIHPPISHPPIHPGLVLINSSIWTQMLKLHNMQMFNFSNCNLIFKLFEVTKIRYFLIKLTTH